MRQVTCMVMAVLLLAWACVVRADLVGYWWLDGDGKDASGNGHDGVIAGNVTPTEDRLGNPAGAMWFGGGGSDLINVGDPPEFQMAGAMTVTAWVYLDGTSPLHGHRNGRILGKMDGGGHRAMSTGIEASGGGIPFPATLQVSSNGSDVVSLMGPTLPVNEWVHYAGVYIPGVAMEIYLNGELVNVRTDVPISQFNTNGNPVLIGNRPACPNCGWYGALDEVRFYDEALSPFMIRAIRWGLLASHPDPVNGDMRAPARPVLSWDPPNPLGLADPNHPENVQYVIYFDPNEALVTARDPSVRFGPQYETTFAVSPDADLPLMTTYYWRVDVIDPNFGDPVTYPGDLWKFTTLPPKAGLIFPENGASGVPQNAVLEWDPGAGAVEHVLYFGTDEALVAARDESVRVGRQTEAFFEPDLDWETQYFWLVDEVFTVGDDPIEEGELWSFTTGAPICEYELEGDANRDCVVDLEDLALMAANWLLCNLTNGNCP